VPDDPICIRLIERFGGPITGTSANKTGKASSACFWRLAVSLVAIIAGIVLWIPLWIVIWLVLWAVAWAIAWGRVSHERGHSAALGLLSPIPVLSLVLFGLLAFDD
jgi:fatty acid desaturase